jgi:hypothetical protein
MTDSVSRDPSGTCVTRPATRDIRSVGSASVAFHLARFALRSRDAVSMIRLALRSSILPLHRGFSLCLRAIDAYAERYPLRLLRPAPPEMGRQSHRFVLEFRDEAGDDCLGTVASGNRADSQPGGTRL